MRTFKSDVKKSVKELGVAFSEPKKKQVGKSARNEEATSSRFGEETEKDSILSSADDVFDVTRAFESDDETSGAVITDKRAKSVGILATIKNASSEWLRDAKERIEGLTVREERAAPAIREMSDRKEPMVRVAKKPGLIPQGDHSKIVRKPAPEAHDVPAKVKPMTQKERGESEAPRWTHTVGEKGLTGDAGRNTKERKKREGKTVPLQPTPVHPAVEQRIPQKEKSKRELRKAELNKPPRAASKEPTDSTRKQDALVRMFSKHKQLVGIVTAATLGTGVVTLAVFFFILTDREEADTTVQAPAASIEVDRHVALPLSDSREAFLTSFSEAVRTADTGVTYVYPVTSNETGENVPATTEDILGVIAPNISGTFVRSLSENITMGSVDNQPFIIVRVRAFDPALAGMLEWEKTIRSDLAPLFDSSITQDVKSTGKVPNGFTDRMARGHKARVLTDANGTMRMIYTFIGEETLMITAHLGALANLLDRMP